MEIYYTKCDRGTFKPLPIEFDLLSPSKIIKQLYHNRKEYYRKGLKLPFYGSIITTKKDIKEGGIIVFAVSFCEEEKVLKIWDARLNGFRKKPYPGITLKNPKCLIDEYKKIHNL
jgi:hypothetical protein